MGGGSEKRLKFIIGSPSPPPKKKTCSYLHGRPVIGPSCTEILYSGCCHFDNGATSKNDDVLTEHGGLLFVLLIAVHLIFSCEAQLNKYTFLSVCPSVRLSVSKTELFIVWSSYDSL